MLEIRPYAGGNRELELLPLSRLGQPSGEYLVAWLQGEPVGHAYLARDGDPPELQDVWVRDDHRRRGIATALTRAAEARAARLGHERLTLEVSETNGPARALYERLGYVRTADPPRPVRGTVQLRAGPLEVDDVLVRYERRLG